MTRVLFLVSIVPSFLKTLNNDPCTFEVSIVRSFPKTLNNDLCTFFLVYSPQFS
jgi:hypothetical protein